MKKFKNDDEKIFSEHDQQKYLIILFVEEL